MENNIQASGFVIQPRLQFQHIRDQMIYQYLVAKASYKATGSIKAGQTIIVIAELEKELDWTRRKINKSLNRLVEEQLISMKTLPQKRGVLITVAGYESFQKLESYTKKQKNVHEDVQEDVNEDVNEDNNEKPCGSRGEDMPENKSVNENVNEDVKENAQLNNITAFINSITNISKPLKDYIAEANVKSMNLTSVEDIETFVDFALRTNALPAGTSKKILISYFDCIRLTRTTCNISAKLLANFIEKLQKYSINQIHYALWKHVMDHDDKKEAYTLGILRNVKEPEARRGLMILKNKKGALPNGIDGQLVTAVGAEKSSTSAEAERLERIAREKGLLREVRDTEFDF
ncbi:hypothetical protein [Bacillus badius]|uniref:Uncharacterized protein n=1 Tax=Bacillus badius TaxID=1455 RepID=A0ABR5AP07_BACBA|nr:hypothetical protein [Bacillus badius]KIL73721.1 hypothetical protein SD77_2998 [Bacillus badius]MED4715263.1 hypothetical protein [Bacillus badius]